MRGLLTTLLSLAARRRFAHADAGCRCFPTRIPRPNCAVPRQPEQIDYRRPPADAPDRPLVLCLGDSVSAPSCKAAAASLPEAEVRSVLFARGSGSVLLNAMTSANIRKCLTSWMGSVKWTAVVFGAGAWDLSSGNGCCAVDAPRLQATVDNIRAIVTAILERAQLAVWVTTAPIAETAVCCRDPRYNYSQPEHLPVTWASIGYCHQDALDQNAAVAAALASFPPHRVATADTHAAVAERCGAHYTDCDGVQSQMHGCNCHFGNATFYDVTGPAIAATLAHALKRVGHHAGHEHHGGGDDGASRRRRTLRGLDD